MEVQIQKSKQALPLSQAAVPLSVNHMVKAGLLSVMVTWTDFEISSCSLRIGESLKSLRERKSLEDPSAHYERSQYFCKTVHVL